MIRKRKTITITSILIISLLLSGCKTTEIINNKLDFYSSNRSQSSTTIQKSAEELEQKEDSIPKYIQGKNIKYYAFEQLNEKQISLYQDIYSVIEGQSEGMTFDAAEYSPDDIADMFRAVMTDHPELFYTTAYKLIKNYKNEELISMKFEPVYDMNQDIVKEYKQKLATVGGNILGTTQGMSNDYEKIKFFIRI